MLKNNLSKFSIVLLIFSVTAGWIYSGWPRVWEYPRIPPKIQKAPAAN